MINTPVSKIAQHIIRKRRGKERKARERINTDHLNG